MGKVKEKLYCYLRVSSDIQESDGGSLDVQREWGKKVSKQLVYSIIRQKISY